MINEIEINKIYVKHGRDKLNPNIAAALAECMTLVGSRVMESLARLAEKQDTDHKALMAAFMEVLAEFSKTPVTTVKAPRAGRHACYCGTIVQTDKCDVCGRAA